MSFQYTQSSNEETIFHEFLKISQKVGNIFFNFYKVFSFFFFNFRKEGKIRKVRFLKKKVLENTQIQNLCKTKTHLRILLNTEYFFVKQIFPQDIFCQADLSNIQQFFRNPFSS